MRNLVLGLLLSAVCAGSAQARDGDLYIGADVGVVLG